MNIILERLRAVIGCHPRCCWLWSLLVAGGCAAPQPPVRIEHVEEPPAIAQPDAERIAGDPEAFLRETLARCEAFEGYEVDFAKQERLGLLIKELKPEEHMRVKFRAHPFSVKMVMLDEDHDFAETLYVEGQNNSKLRCRRRKALWPGADPPVNDYDPAWAVTFGRSVNPITDFGVARLMQRVVGTLDQAIDMNLPPRIEYRGITELAIGSTPAHHIRLTYPPETGFERLQVDLMFHADSLLPAASYTWLAAGHLQGRYFYTDFDLDVTFDDSDFQLSETPPTG